MRGFKSARPLGAALLFLSFLPAIAALSDVRTAYAGEISPVLAERLGRLTPDESLTVLVHMRDQAPLSRLDAALRLRRASRAARHEEGVRLLQLQARGQAALLARLEALRGQGLVDGFTPYWISSLIVVRGRPAVIEEIAARADVARVEPNFSPRLIGPVDPNPSGAGRGPSPGGEARAQVPPGIVATGATRVWRELGIDGTGRLVANFDTGVDATHPALRSRWRGVGGAHAARECWLDLTEGDPALPHDSNGHGTHVMGTITGLSVEDRDTIGVAPGAEWIAAATGFANTGDPFVNEVVQAFQWFADPDGNASTIDDVPDVIQNSWGLSADEFGHMPCADYWWSVIDACEALGIVTTWSAGNEGPANASLIVPADRASSPTNCFSVGAVNATAYTWPFPIANFSSRGPSFCGDAPELRFKPEIVAPGVAVRSSVPGNNYAFYQGTSMAGPHVAGVVALIRQADPDLPVEEVKQLLLDTARDLGPAGEDNTYGHGFVDAHAAILRMATRFGRLRGLIVNASVAERPVRGALIRRLEDDRTWRSDAEGRFSALMLGSRWRFTASAEGLEPDSLSTDIVPGETTSVVFRLEDRRGPRLAPIDAPTSTTDSLGPYSLLFSAVDPSDVDRVDLLYRRDPEPWATLAMSRVPVEVESPDSTESLWSASLPRVPTGNVYEYSSRARDRAGHTTDWPPPPEPARRLQIRRGVAATSFEGTVPPGWELGPDHAAASGTWTWADPVGTEDEGVPVQPEDDATPGPGTHCFVTGNGLPDERAGIADVDSGCTALMSPLFDLSGVDQGWVVYSRWYAESGASQDDTFEVDVSSDGGATWVALERVAESDPTWRRVELRLDERIALTNEVRLRWVACDIGAPGVTEAALDDVSVETFTLPRPDLPDPEPEPTPRATRLLPSVPNPAFTISRVRFELARRGPVTLELFDAQGRRVRTLADRDFEAGSYEIAWDGRTARGHRAANGIYFVRLRAPDGEYGGRLELLR